MRKRINRLLDLFNKVALPFDLSNDYTQWVNYIKTNPEKFSLTEDDLKEKSEDGRIIGDKSEEEILRLIFWNPELFPKPEIDEKGNVNWILPASLSVYSEEKSNERSEPD